MNKSQIGFKIRNFLSRLIWGKNRLYIVMGMKKAEIGNLSIVEVMSDSHINALKHAIKYNGFYNTAIKNNNEIIVVSRVDTIINFPIGEIGGYL